MLSLIAAMGTNRAVGLNNQMPWHMPADLKHFKAVTLNKPVVMGRKTYESIGMPLPNRRNIILSQRTELIVPGCEVLHSMNQVLLALKDQAEIMVIGGANIYQQSLPLAERLYLTFINHRFIADAYFPEWNEQEWRELSREDHEADENNAYPYSFVTLEKV